MTSAAGTPAARNGPSIVLLLLSSAAVRAAGSRVRCVPSVLSMPLLPLILLLLGGGGAASVWSRTASSSTTNFPTIAVSITANPSLPPPAASTCVCVCVCVCVCA